MEPARTRQRREPAIRMLAEEFRDASLHEESTGEYEPSFVITRLGARVNRLLVAGLLERFERRDTDSGPMYDLQLRDPTGPHYVRVGSFTPELLPTVERIEQRWEGGEPMLLMCIGKSRAFRTEEGAVYTSCRAESLLEVTREDYIRWLIEAADATLRRMHWAEQAIELEPTPAAYDAAGIPKDLRHGLQMARGHYGPADPLQYEVGVRRTLDRAEDPEPITAESDGGDPAETATPAPDSDRAAPSGGVAPAPASGGMDLEAVKAEIESMVRLQDTGEGVDFQSVINTCKARGVDAALAEEALDALHEEGTLVDHRFGWYRHIDTFTGDA